MGRSWLLIHTGSRQDGREPPQANSSRRRATLQQSFPGRCPAQVAVASCFQVRRQTTCGARGTRFSRRAHYEPHGARTRSPVEDHDERGHGRLRVFAEGIWCTP